MRDTMTAAQRRLLAGRLDRGWPSTPTKENARCCRAKMLPDGRPVIGYCGRQCVRRPR